METIAERYDRLSATFSSRVAAVHDDQWDDPTPCDDWTVRDLVAHVVESHGMFVGFIDRELPAGPSVADDPVAAFAGARDAVLTLLRDPATATHTYEGHLGTRTFEWAVDSFLSFDLVVHGWDLARATGQDETIDPEDLDRVARDAEEWGDMARAPGVFGQPVEAPSDADAQTRVLAFLGRRP